MAVSKDAPLSRFASSPQGDATRGLAKPVPRWPWYCVAPVSRASQASNNQGVLA